MKTFYWDFFVGQSLVWPLSSRLEKVIRATIQILAQVHLKDKLRAEVIFLCFIHLFVSWSFTAETWSLKSILCALYKATSQTCIVFLLLLPNASVSLAEKISGKGKATVELMWVYSPELSDGCCRTPVSHNLLLVQSTVFPTNVVLHT